MADFNMESMGLTFRVKEVLYKAIDGKSGPVDSEFISNDVDYTNIDDAIADFKTRIGISDDTRYKMSHNFDEARVYYAENHPSGNQAKAYVSLEYFYNATPEFREQLKQLNVKPFGGVFTGVHGIVPSQSFQFPLVSLIGPNGIMIEKDSDPRIMDACQKINQEIVQYGLDQTWQDIQDLSKEEKRPQNDVQQQIGQTVQDTLDQNVQQDIGQVVASALDQDVQSEIGQVVQNALDQQNETADQQAQPAQQDQASADVEQTEKKSEMIRIYFDRDSVKKGRTTEGDTVNEEDIRYIIPIRWVNSNSDYIIAVASSVQEDPQIANECGAGWCFIRVPSDMSVDYVHRYDDGKNEFRKIDAVELGKKMRPYVEVEFPQNYISKPFKSKMNGNEYVSVRVPKLDPDDKRLWEVFVVSHRGVHELDDNQAIVRYSPNAKIKLNQNEKDGNEYKLVSSRKISPKELKTIYDTYKVIMAERNSNRSGNDAMADDEKKAVGNVHNKVSDHQKTIPKPEQSPSVKIDPR